MRPCSNCGEPLPNHIALCSKCVPQETKIEAVKTPETPPRKGDLENDRNDSWIFLLGAAVLFLIAIPAAGFYFSGLVAALILVVTGAITLYNLELLTH